MVREVRPFRCFPRHPGELSPRPVGVPYLGRVRLRELSRDVIDTWRASVIAEGAGAPTVNRCLGILQRIRGPSNGADSLRTRSPASSACLISAIRQLTHARPRSSSESAMSSTRPTPRSLAVLAYDSLRPAEAFTLSWVTFSTSLAFPASGYSSVGLSRTTRSRRQNPGADERPNFFEPVARELAELYLSSGRPSRSTLVFPGTIGGYLRRQNRRKRAGCPLLSGPTFVLPPARPRPHVRDALIYEGRTLDEVAEHLGHAGPGSRRGRTRTSSRTL
jgi:hypothetical protein